MKEWSRRNKVLASLVIILLLAVYLWPISLGSRVPEEASLSITWVEFDVTPPADGEVYSSLDNQVTSYLLEGGTEERKAFQDLLNGYTIHRTWRTPFPANGLNDSNGGFLHITWTEDEQFIHQVTTGFAGPLMIDNHIYGLGYLDKFLSLDMKERTLAFLGHCTPMSDNES